MASKLVNILGHARRLVKFRDFRTSLFKKKISIPPKVGYKYHVPEAKPKSWAWKFARSFFRNPQLFRRGPFAPIRLGFAIGLAINFTDTQEFRQINDVANTCLQSDLKQGKRLDLSSLRQLQTGPFLTKGCHGAVYAARPADPAAAGDDYPLAVKMLFNYSADDPGGGARSDEKIAEAFRAETVPFALPAHPSIARVHGAVVEAVPRLPRAEAEFPSALPPSLYPGLRDCFGEERTLFLIMQRYSSSLHAKLQQRALTPDECLQVLLQLLEGDVFLKRHGIAHRDLHAKNVLLEEGVGGALRACISDFGCATDRLTAASAGRLALDTAPGIPLLQAPEVADAGDGASPDYSKADLWAIATLVFEMCQPGGNPFLQSGGLDARHYSEAEVPRVRGAPAWVDALVHEMLRRDPAERPSSEVCADVVHMMALRVPAAWIVGAEGPSLEAVREWLVLKLAALIVGRRRDHLAAVHLLFFNRITARRFRNRLLWLRHLLLAAP